MSPEGNIAFNTYLYYRYLFYTKKSFLANKKYFMFINDFCADEFGIFEIIGK